MNRIEPLIIAKKQNTGLILNICKELDTGKPHNFIGDEWSLKLFIKADMKNCHMQTDFILDVSAFKEKDDVFIGLLDGIKDQADNAKIIIFANEYHPGDDFLNALVQAGFTNIVANIDTKNSDKNRALMTEDLKECLTTGLSTEKYERYDKTVKEKPKEIIVPTTKIYEKTYEKAKLKIGVIGTQNRIGTTTAALHFCDYFERRKGNVSFVFADEKAALSCKMFCSVHNVLENDNYKSINNIRFYDNSNNIKEDDSNIIVYDFGSIKNPHSLYSSNFKLNKLMLVGGVNYSELGNLFVASNELSDVNYSLLINFADTSLCDKYNEELLTAFTEYYILAFDPKPFSAFSNDKLFDNLFIDFSDEKQIEYEENQQER